MAELSDPSPITAITLLRSPAMSRALARPQASEMDVPVCPSTNWSCSLSSGLVNPVTESCSAGSR